MTAKSYPAAFTASQLTHPLFSETSIPRFIFVVSFLDDVLFVCYLFKLCPQERRDDISIAQTVNVLYKAQPLDQGKACNHHIPEEIKAHSGVKEEANQNTDKDTCFFKEPSGTDRRTQAVLLQSDGYTCDDIKTHQDGEGLDGGVDTADSFVKAGEADAEDGT